MTFSESGRAGEKKSSAGRFFFMLLPLTFFVLSCSKGTETINIDGIVAEVKIERLEQEFFGLSDTEEIIDFLNRNEEMATNFFGFDPQSLEAINQMEQMLQDPYMDTLRQESIRVFGDMEDLRAELELAFRRIKYYFPDFQEPRVCTMISGLGSDLYVSENLIIIGIDFFLGEGAKFRPADVPNYILQRYQKQYIVPSIVLLISDRFNFSDQADNTMLSEMITYGKAYYFCQKILPQTPMELIIAYVPAQVADIYENEGVIWAHFLDNQLLYETSHFVKNKYMGERPFVAEIGRRCPGRIGAWLGWRIVDTFMVKNPQLNLSDLMAHNQAGELFLKSGYRPGK
jgi:gliding motility-associated lipoprotein GldB